MKLTKRILPVLFSLILIVSCKDNVEKEIIIFSTNDIHAKIDDFAKVSAYVKAERTKNPNTLLINAGDMFSGNPVVDQYSDRGYPIIDIMNEVGYDLTTMGNHEFDYDREFLAKRMTQSNFKWVVANLKVSPEGIIPQPDPYVILTVDGVTLSFLGLVEISKSTMIPSTHPDRVKGITFTDPIEEALNYRGLRLRSDVFIALAHLGVSTDVKLAEKMPELDLIIGGHSHTKIDTSMVVNGVLITQADSWLRYIGKTTLVVKGGKVLSKKNELIPVKELVEVDTVVQQMVDHYKAASGLSEVLGENLSAINSKEQLGNLMTDAITYIHKVDIAFQNSGGVRINRLPKGDITKASIYELDPFGNEVIVYDMTAAQIRELVYDASKTHGGKADLFVSGITYAISAKGKADDVVLKTMDGKKLDEKKVYKVGMNSYIASSYKLKANDEGRSLYTTSAETLMSYIRKKGKIDYANEKGRTAVN